MKAVEMGTMKPATQEDLSPEQQIEKIEEAMEQDRKFGEYDGELPEDLPQEQAEAYQNQIEAHHKEEETNSMDV